MYFLKTNQFVVDIFVSCVQKQTINNTIMRQLTVPHLYISLAAIVCLHYINIPITYVYDSLVFKAGSYLRLYHCLS